MRVSGYFYVLLLVVATKTYGDFAPSTICVDVNGNPINCPASDSGLIFSDSYQLLENSGTTTVLQKTTGSPSYSSYYSSQVFKATEETVDNFNQIGSKVGVHWIARYAGRIIEEKLNFVQGTISKPLVSVNTKWFKWEAPVITTKQIINTEMRLVVTGFSLNWSLRSSISDVNTFNPSSGTDGIERLPSLSNNPSLKGIINIHSAGDAYTSPNCLGSAYVLQGKGDNNPWNRTLIVVDGFDPRCRISIQEILEDVPYSLAPFASQFIGTLTDKGYDVVFVDCKDGGRDIIENARVVLKVIEEVCARSGGNVIVGGYSMGGLVARTALLLGQKNSVSNMQKVTKFLSIDAPLLGGQVNLDFQEKLVEISSSKMTDPVDYLFREKVFTVVYDIKSKAARQMLFTHAVSSEHDAFYSFIKSIGDYPANMKKISIADASWKWPYPGANINGEAAAIINGKTLYVKDEDLHPGAYIDLWASSMDFHVNGRTIAGLFSTIFAGVHTGAIAGTSTGPGAGFDTYQPSSTRYGDTRYLPTHIPLYSAFGIEKNTFLAINEPKNQADLDNIAKQYSPFDKLYLIDYENRYKHIQFDNTMSGKVLAAIKKIDMTPVLQLLLSD